MGRGILAWAALVAAPTVAQHAPIWVRTTVGAALVAAYEKGWLHLSSSLPFLRLVNG